MGEIVEVNQGEVLVKFTKPVSGKVTFEELGLKDELLNVEGGFFRLVFDFGEIGEHHYYNMPTIQITYNKVVKETHWVCDFNRITILDKTDHYGRSTVMLLNRNKISRLEHHHENKLVVQAEFPEPVTIITKDSYINFFV